MSTAITIQPGAGHMSIVDGRKTRDELVAQRNAIVEAMQSVMKKDLDYGVIPGTKKPTLYKPGSEKILSMFHLAAKPRVEDLSTPDCIRYRVFVAVIHYPTGTEVGEGVGEASSAESKYQWRKALCGEEWDSFPPDRRRLKWQKAYGGGVEQIEQVRAEMEDVANTVLKIAKKRAQIDATLTATAASDMFEQDIEDLRDNGVDINPDADPPANAQPQQTQRRPEDLQRRPDAQQSQPRQQAAPQPQVQNNGGPAISAQQARMWWAKAMETHKDHKILMDYLRAAFGVSNKDFIPASRWADALAWAEGKAR